MLTLNFTHPLTTDHRRQIEMLIGQPLKAIQQEE